MIATLVKRALGDLQTAFKRAKKLQTAGRPVASDDTVDVYARDMGVLEDRVLFSATPMGAMGASPDPSADQHVGQPPGHWMINSDFSDEGAEMFDPQLGSWQVIDARYQAASEADAISTLILNEPLSDNLEFNATLNADDASASHLSNGFMIFDYQGPNDFKFAGAYVGTDRWIVGHRADSGWVIDAFQQAPIDAMTDYNLRLAINGDSQVTLYVNEMPQLSHSYGDSLTDGQLGLGTRDAVCRFDDVQLRSLPADDGATPGELPLFEDFDDGQADHLRPELGSWMFIDGAYQVSPDLADQGISTLLLSDPIPQDVEVGVTFSADEFSPARFSNGFIVFDYQGPTDFKYAGGFLFRDEWAIGQRTVDGWFDHVVLSAPLDAFAEYDLRLVVENGSDVFLYESDNLLASHSYGESVTDGAIGLGSDNSVTRFDSFSVLDNSPVSTITAELVGRNLVVSGDAAGELEIVAIDKHAFQILDGGRLMFTVDDVKGNLRVELSEADDQVIIDLGGQKLRRNVKVDLGDGDNHLEIRNGSMRGSLRVGSGDGNDSLIVGDDVTVGRHGKLWTGAGDDSLDVSGTFRRALFVNSGTDNDSMSFSGRFKALFAGAGDGDDRVEILAQSELKRFAWVNLGAGDDSFVNDATDQRVVPIDEDRDDSDSLSDDHKLPRRWDLSSAVKHVFDSQKWRTR